MNRVALTARALARRLLSCLPIVLLAASAQAQSFPDRNRPIRFVVPSGAASVVDLLARAYAKAISETSGLNVVVDNKPGAEQVIGIQAFLAAPADGYTVLINSNAGQTLNPVMLPNLPYDPIKDLMPLAGFSTAGLIMNLGTSTPFQNARDFIASARANPGKYTCASASTNTRMACELLQATAGVKVLNVPYKVTAAAMTAVASGEADVIFVDAGTARAQWQTGRVRGVAVTRTTRMSSLPNLPTMREQGVPEFDMTAWYASYVSPRTPPEVVTVLRDVMRKASATRTIADALLNFGMEPLESTPDELVALTRRETDMWARVVRTQGIKPGS